MRKRTYLVFGFLLLLCAGIWLTVRLFNGSGIDQAVSSDDSLVESVNASEWIDNQNIESASSSSEEAQGPIELEISLDEDYEWIFLPEEFWRITSNRHLGFPVDLILPSEGFGSAEIEIYYQIQVLGEGKCVPGPLYLSMEEWHSLDAASAFIECKNPGEVCWTFLADEVESDEVELPWPKIAGLEIRGYLRSANEGEAEDLLVAQGIVLIYNRPRLSEPYLTGEIVYQHVFTGKAADEKSQEEIKLKADKTACKIMEQEGFSP